MVYQIALLKDPEEVLKIDAFLKKHPLDYPDYLLWAKKCRKQLELGEKRAFFAIDDGIVIGSAVFQVHREDSSTLEIKNFRVDEKYRNQGVGTALEELVESYARSAGFKRIVGDAHQENLKIIAFLKKKGYREEAAECLYSPKKVEIILAKKW